MSLIVSPARRSSTATGLNRLPSRTVYQTDDRSARHPQLLSHADPARAPHAGACPLAHFGIVRRAQKNDQRS